MGKSRLEAFSDGVLAIVITIMVLELKVPHGDSLADLVRLWPVFISYVLSFVYVGIYWTNHHHLLHTVKKVTGPMMLANLHLLFWLSLFPFTTGWVGENRFAALPMFVYGLNFLLAAVAYQVLARAIVAAEGRDSILARAMGADVKGYASIALYVVGILLAFVYPWVAFAAYTLVAAIWFFPDRRIEKMFAG